ncbi:MAG: HAD-IIB family hydrolase [Bacilli bacterium]
MKQIRMVLCDIDNTLIVRHKILTSRAKEAIKLIKASGAYFGIASGRSLEEIKRMMNRWGIEQPDILIGLNGSALYDGIHKKEYNYFLLKREWIHEIIDLMSVFDSNPLIYLNDQIICREMDEIVKRSSESAEMKVVISKEKKDFYSQENAKIMFRVNEDEMSEIESYLEERASPFYYAFKSQKTMIEFSDKRVSKAYALAEICEKLEVPINEVITFGDTTNDNAMLVTSGIGVCMCNGSEDTKRIADIITEKKLCR